MEGKGPSCQTTNNFHHRQRVRPLFTLQNGSDSNLNNGESRLEKKGTDVSSVCFLTRPSGKLHRDCDVLSSDSDSNTDEDSDNDGTLLQELQCRSLVFQKTNNTPIESSLLIDQATTMELGLTDTLLASSHVNGEAWLWDLNRRFVACPLVPPTDQREKGPGVTISRLGDHRYNTFLYQTRDIDGTVTVHDVNGSNAPCKIVSSFKTYSQTFCAATASRSCENIIALPSAHESFVTLRDLRMDPTDAPIGIIHGAGVTNREDWRKEGMLMSISLCGTNGGHNGGENILGCGMESGSIFFHDLAMMGEKARARKCDNSKDTFKNVQQDVTSVKLGKQPILCLDSCFSCDYERSTKIKSGHEQKSHTKKSQSIVTIAGTAGDAAELLSLPVQERGTVAVIKTSLSTCSGKGRVGIHADASNNNLQANTAIKSRVRAQVGTCKLSEDILQGGKPGVGTCRLRPDGRVFAVGGWDKRVRIYSRTNARLLAVLNGPNDAAVTCLDWLIGEEDLIESGILASGSGDGKISLWRAFPT